ncbi:glycosyltransferase [Acetobacter farinalis]|uniref:Glycosyltransferase n=1 Tax=Acetobacter farinalis TaxID=1260984 RepID=A0ABT3Q5I4_9PROT|nr:glycosyltransferase [Acetobacter farinalis]MCX2560550.1 glycosyltransferase [Acetobacter farinalis]NHO29309.1 glycosyltransferase [Acetobacter farinalis]
MPASSPVSASRKPIIPLAALCGTESDPFFTPVMLADDDTAGCGHLPFIVWLLSRMAPETLVLIQASRSVRDTVNTAVHSRILPTRILEVPSFQRHSEAGCTLYYYGNPLWQMPDRLKAEMASLPEGSLVLLEGTSLPAAAPIWGEFEKDWPSFRFFHADGLGVLARVPLHIDDVNLILTKDAALSEEARLEKTLFRNRFSQSGEFWENKAALATLHKQTQALQEKLRLDRISLIEYKHSQALLKTELAELKSTLRKTQETAHASSASARRNIARLEKDNAALLSQALSWQNFATTVQATNTTLSESLSRFHKNASLWAAFSQDVLTRAEGLNALRDFLSTPAGLLRSLARMMVRGSMAPFVPELPTPPVQAELPAPDSTFLPPVPPEPVALPAPPPADQNVIFPERPPGGDASRGAVSPSAPVTPRSPRRKVLFVAGEPESPGVQYRCIRNAAACVRAGHEARWKPCAEVNPEDLGWADTVILWRVEFSGHVDILLQLARENGADIIFDTDDITFLPHMARFDIIDGIRSIGATEQRIEAVFTEMRRTLMRSDLCFAPTDTLAGLMRINKPLTYTVPNTFDPETLRRSRMAMRKKQQIGPDGLVRIGYATGSRTHQRDFARVAGVLASLMRGRPEVRLVLFREPGNHRPVLLMNEFPELASVEGQIEWRDMVPLPDLPEETARFDIAIAPLEAGTLFCDAKSELKFFEAALAGVPAIVSPTTPFRQCVVDGVSGFLADTPEEWDRALRTLIDNPALRHTMADAAYHSSLWFFGPQRQALVFDSILEGLGGEQAAAQAAEIQIARGDYRGKGLPQIPSHDVLFHHDALGEAAVSVLVTSYNYAAFILEALESVRAQTLETLDLVVVDDGSSDESVALIKSWMAHHTARFNRLVLLKTSVNAGLGGARNCGVAHVETPFFLPLDADNRLLPEACASLLAATNEMTAYAYPILEQFGDPTQHKLLGDKPFHPMRLVAGNYIDAMALVAKWAWAAAGGYYVSRSAMGWEDYDLWCSFAELGLQGTHVPEILAEYRVHRTSMTSSVTEQDAHKRHVVALVEHRHDWIKLVQKEAKDRT